MTGILLETDASVTGASIAGGSITGTSPVPVRAAAPPGARRTGRSRPPELEAATAVRAAALGALQRVLEVLDGRRPRGLLSRCVDEQVLAQLTALIQHRVVGPGDDCARLCRVHVQLHDAALADYFGSYVRGGRVRAVAGRMELRPVRVSPAGTLPRKLEDRWILTEFAIV